MRKKTVAGNWKMNKTYQEAVDLLVKLADHTINPDKCNVIIAPPYVYLDIARKIATVSPIAIAAQDCSAKEKGAYTGEISANMIKSAGADYVIIGHSERRMYHKENDALLNEKIDMALKSNLKVIFCIGETLEERNNNQQLSVIERQLKETVFKLDSKDFENVLIAYEPVWAIGTGVTATTAQAQEMHLFIRDLIAGNYHTNLAESTAILYGGSCNAANAKDLFACKDIDGGLIGGASLKAEDFIQIIESV